LNTIRNSRTEQPLAEDTYTFVDPLKGYRITARQKEEQDEITTTQRYVYPAPTPAQCGSSEPGKEPVLVPEKKPNLLPLGENRTENRLSVSLDDLTSVYWKEEFSKKQCGVCGYEKETSWEAATTKAQVIAICGDCVREFQKKQEV
jgi:hypothetical protein